MLPQHLVCKYELNCEYCNITLERNKAPWWWSDKIETCRSVLKCFKSVTCEIICAFVGWFNWNDSTKNGRCYNKIYNSKGWPLHHSHRCHVIFIAIHLPTSSLSLTQHNCFLRLHLHCLLCWIHPLDEKFCWHFYILKYFF